MLGYPLTPPPSSPGSPAANRLTHRPPRFGSTPLPPRTAPKTVAHPLGSLIGWEQPTWHAPLHEAQTRRGELISAPPPPPSVPP